MTHSCIQGPPASNASHHYGPPTANDHLRESMHGSINWKERQIEGPPPSPSRTSRNVARWVVVMVIGGILLGMFAAARTAERDPERPWVVWLVDADKPWLNPRNNLPATATGPHACNISLTEITKALPSGTRLSYLKKPTRGE